jgi:hypothetical protein
MTFIPVAELLKQEAPPAVKAILRFRGRKPKVTATLNWLCPHCYEPHSLSETLPHRNAIQRVRNLTCGGRPVQIYVEMD